MNIGVVQTCSYVVPLEPRTSIPHSFVLKLESRFLVVLDRLSKGASFQAVLPVGFGFRCSVLGILCISSGLLSFPPWRLSGRDYLAAWRKHFSGHRPWAQSESTGWFRALRCSLPAPGRKLVVLHLDVRKSRHYRRPENCNIRNLSRLGLGAGFLP